MANRKSFFVLNWIKFGDKCNWGSGPKSFVAHILKSAYMVMDPGDLIPSMNLFCSHGPPLSVSYLPFVNLPWGIGFHIHVTYYSVRNYDYVSTTMRSTDPLPLLSLSLPAFSLSIGKTSVCYCCALASLHSSDLHTPSFPLLVLIYLSFLWVLPRASLVTDDL